MQASDKYANSENTFKICKIFRKYTLYIFAIEIQSMNKNLLKI